MLSCRVHKYFDAFAKKYFIFQVYIIQLRVQDVACQEKDSKQQIKIMNF